MGSGHSKTLRRAGIVAGTTAAAVGVASTAGTLGTVSYLAHRLLTPERDRPDNCVILAVDETTITFDDTEETGLPGRYGVWFAGGAGHLRVGEVVRREPGRITRDILGVDVGEPRPGGARWNGYYFWDSPQVCLGLPTRDVTIASDVGDLDAWVTPGRSSDTSASGRWAVMVHGRGAVRQECVRAVPTFHGLGITSLIPVYRNDPGAPPSADGKHNLGLSEWRDVEAAVQYALAHGAKDIVLCGWSMGGATALQFLARSTLAACVAGVVLDGPVVDWGDVIRHHGSINRVPRVLTSLTSDLIGQRWARRIVRVHEPLDVASTNWDDRADELRHPILLIHSLYDDFVPSGPSEALARRRPDLVTFVSWRRAAHTKEWNTDPERWDAVVRDFVAQLR